MQNAQENGFTLSLPKHPTHYGTAMKLPRVAPLPLARISSDQFRSVSTQ